jgi:hypothetical protein
LSLAAVTTAGLLGPFQVKTGAANEQSPAASPDWYAWTQSPASHPNRTNVWAEARPVDGTDAFIVNRAGTRAWTGGIEGDTLVYQQVSSGNSNIRRYDLSAQAHRPNPPRINTVNWEWHPSISTDSNGDRWIMFGRQNVNNGAQWIFAYNVAQDRLRLLQSTTNRRYSFLPGQVNGNWATWTVCRPNCNVRYVNLVNGSSVATVPKPSTIAHQYASSVADDGTVYFVQSGDACGANVKIDRYRAGVREVLTELPRRRDIFFTYTSEETDGNHVHFDRVGCGTGAWNTYRIVDGP